MNDIKCDGDNFHFIYRVGALILNKDKTKVLLYYGNGADFYMLPGGKVKGLETSKKAIERELAEELGYKDLNFKFIGINEEIVRGKDFNAHQLTMIYECIFKEEITNNIFKGQDSEYNNFEWIDIQALKQIKTYPQDIYSIIKNDNTINHIVEDIQE